jgi:hypothetical protein
MSDWKRNIVVIIVLQTALGLVYLKTAPRVYYDDIVESSYGRSLAYTGTIRDEVSEGYGGMEFHYVQPRIILPLVCAVIFKVAGYSIVTARIGSLIFGVLAIVALYAIMRHWFGEKQAIWIAVTTIIHPWFFEISRRCRSEIYCTALAIAALWCVVHWLDTNSRRAAFLAGALAALAGLAHPTGLILDFAIAAAVFIWLRTKTTWRLVLWAFLGFVTAILPYIIYVLLCIQDPRVSFSGQVVPQLLHKLWLTGEIYRWKNFLQGSKGIPLAGIMLASWLLAWYRSTTGDKVFATIIGLFCLVLPFASVNTAGRYLAVLTPFFSALLVRLVWRIMADHGILLYNRYKLRFVASVGIAAIYVSICVTGISLMFYHLRGADFDRVLDRIVMVVGKEDRVYGEPLLWLGHGRYRYGPYPRDFSVYPWRPTIDMIRKHHFDYAIRSAWTFGSSYGVASPPADMPNFRPDNMIDQVCKQFGTKVAEFRDPYFGPFEIYKLDWDNNSNSGDELRRQKTGTGTQD